LPFVFNKQEELPLMIGARIFEPIVLAWVVT
jgi:hypothetical protein